MKWTYAIKNKLTASILLFIALALVLLNNIIEQRHSEQVTKAIESIYDDRLVVESYIYHYSDLLHKIVEAVDDTGITTGEGQAFVHRSLNKIEELNLAYAKTKLTTEEAEYFKNFRVLCVQLKQEISNHNYETGKMLSKKALDILDKLSGIQLSEGKQELKAAEKMYHSSSLFSKFELAVIILLTISIQALVFASRTLKVKPNNPGSLN